VPHTQIGIMTKSEGADMPTSRRFPLLCLSSPLALLD
jgi:hypothetical protein